MPKQINKITHLLSYFYNQPLATASSTYNPILELSLSRGRLLLNTDNATYSYGDLYDTFYRPFKQLKFKEKNLQNVLVLGWGLGSIPIMLQKKFNQVATQYDAVEIDAEVIKLNKTYLPASLLSKSHFYCQDAYEFIMESTNKYDLICIDIFLDTVTPNKFRSQPFLEKAKQLLNPKGYLLYNTLTLDATLKKASEAFYKDTFSPTFPSAFIVKTPGNNMLIYQQK